MSTRGLFICGSICSMHDDYTAIIPAPFAALGIRVADARLTAIDFLPPDTPALPARDAASAAVCTRLQAYLQTPDTPLDLPIQLAGTAFQQRVWRAMQAIPPGRTLTYGALAQQLDSGARAVANACGANPIPLVIPCHRVVASNGLGGFMGGREQHALAIKHWLLAHERCQSDAA